MMERVKYLSFLTLLLPAMLFGQSGKIVGTITDAGSGETLIGATVVVEGTTKGTITDFEGNYFLDNLEPGTYNIVISYVAYNTEKHDEVLVKAGNTTVLDAQLEEATTVVEAVKIIGRANQEAEAVILLEQKEATVIKESVGAIQLSNMGVSDAATATTKISGVSKTEGTGDIYVRGLGDRYLSTTLNHLPVPPDDIDKKNINLGLFSTDIISNVGISKTYTVSNYADLTSGNVDITTKTLNRDKILEIGIAGGVNSSIIEAELIDNFKASQNKNDISVLGYYKKTYETEESITRQSWNTTALKNPLNRGISLVAGRKIKLFDRELSILATASHSSSFEYQEGIYRKNRMNDSSKVFNDVEIFKTKINITGLLNLTYDLNVGHSLMYNFLYVHKTEDGLYERGRNKEGFFRDFVPEETGVYTRDQNTKETHMIINQLVGKHTLNENNKIKWALGYNNVIADEPNRFRYEVSYITDQDRWKFGRVSNFHIKKSMQEIEDREINGYILEELSIRDEEHKRLKLIFGGNYRIKNRSFKSLARGVRADLDQVSIASIDNMDEVLLDQDLYESGALRIDRTLPMDLFDATLSAFAGYADLFYENGNISGSFGLRYEFDQLNADWDVGNFIDLETGMARIGRRSNNYSNILPALNLKYQLSEKNAIRLAASKTLTLPEFKEISPFEYVSPDGDVTKGNADLKHSVNYNTDLKWEIYPSSRELISVTGFYKLINDPINLALTRGSSGYFKYDNTGDKATVYGLEFEAKYGLIKPSESNKPGLNLSVNATKMWFKQDLLDYFQYNNITESGLEGASGFIANGSLSFTNNKPNKFITTITANYSSDKIYALGAPESQGDKLTLFNSEIIEKGFATIDIVLSKKISDKISIKLKANNLLNPTIERTQFVKSTNDVPRTETVKTYKKGISLGLGIKIDLN